MDRREAEAVVLRTGWLAAQPEAFRAALLQRAAPAAFARGEVLFRADDAPGGVYGLAQGALGVYVPIRDAGPTLGHLAHPGTWVGHGPLFTRGPRTLSFRALEQVAALHVGLPALDELLRDPASARAIGALGNANVDVAVAAVADLMIRRADRRIAAVLLRAAGLFGGAPAPVATDLPLSQADLGEMANASRHLVNRTLSGFERRGWVALSYARIALRDPAALAGFASGAA